MRGRIGITLQLVAPGSSIQVQSLVLLLVAIAVFGVINVVPAFYKMSLEIFYNRAA